MQRRADGAIWHDTGGRAYDFWTRYLDVFDEVVVLARVFAQSGSVAGPVEGSGVRVHPLPGYGGVSGSLLARRAAKRSISSACDAGADAFLARVPGQVGDLLVSELRRRQEPYSLEVVGDPYEVLSAGGTKAPLRPLVQRAAYLQLKRQCAGASTSTYVTRAALQRRYPPAPGTYSGGFSDVDLPPDAFASGPRPESRRRPPTVTAVSVGMLSPHKGHDVLVRAASKLGARELPMKVRIVGEGPHRAIIEHVAASADPKVSLELLGRLPSGAAVRSALDEADIFVLPSRGGEGLPRALLEAMARGLPCVATDLGGVGELLHPSDLVPARDEDALAALLALVVSDPKRLAEMSRRNLARAHEFSRACVASERIAFLGEVAQQRSSRAARMPQPALIEVDTSS